MMVVLTSDSIQGWVCRRAQASIWVVMQSVLRLGRGIDSIGEAQEVERVNLALTRGCAAEAGRIRRILRK